MDKDFPKVKFERHFQAFMMCMETTSHALSLLCRNNRLKAWPLLITRATMPRFTAYWLILASISPCYSLKSLLLTCFRTTHHLTLPCFTREPAIRTATRLLTLSSRYSSVILCYYQEHVEAIRSGMICNDGKETDVREPARQALTIAFCR